MARDVIAREKNDSNPDGKMHLRYKGTFDFTYLYRTVQRWFEQRRFRFYETRIKDTGKRIKDDWQAIREIDEYSSEQYNIKIEMWNLTTQEIMVNGEPRKILNGMVQFTIWGILTVDRNDFFAKGGKFMNFLGDLLYRARFREIESNQVDVMDYRLQDVLTLIKECLNMATKENAPW